MDLRKIISFGNSSYVISLPKGWITRNRIKKGDLIDVDERPTELILTPQDKGERRSIQEITIEERGKSSEILRAEIVSAYLSNYDVITVTGLEKEEKHAEVKKVLNILVGMEVIEETASKIVAKDLLDITEVSLDKVIRRADILIRAMYMDALLSGKIVDVTDRDVEVNRQAFLGYRVVKAAFDNPRLAKAFDTSYLELLIARRVLTALEHFADNVKRMSRVLEKVNVERCRRFNGLHRQIYERYLETMKIYYAKDKEKAFVVSVDTKKLFAESEKPLKKYEDINCARAVEHLKGMVDSLSTLLRCVTDYKY